MDTKNNYMNPQNANRQLKHILKAMNIAGISTHSLRHTYGTRCIEAGMRAVALQRLMGHTDISITLNTYTSVFNKYKENELEKVNQYYMDNDIVKNNDYICNYEQTTNTIQNEYITGQIINMQKRKEKELEII